VHIKEHTTWILCFTERSEDLKQSGDKLNSKEHDPELLIQAMEKTSAIFDRCVSNVY
jgi:hypothetical protein